jgi:predicted glutamine amidotransferase
MCRFVAYFGQEEVLLDKLLAKPKNSLIKQSHESREGGSGVNADGFGVAWYNFDISSYPGVFKSIQPAWNDNNLMHISQKTKSSCFLAHVRASTVGDVNQNNCHPFYFGKYSMVHNGTIRNFAQYKKKLIDEIDEDLFLQIKGNTDSECLFFLIINFVRYTNDLELSVKEAISWVIKVQKKCIGFSRINIAITNGDELIATRFVSKGEKSLSLKYTNNFEVENKLSSLVLSSEPLNDDDGLWKDVPENHYIYINKKNMKSKIVEL